MHLVKAIVSVANLSEPLIRFGSLAAAFRFYAKPSGGLSGLMAIFKERHIPITGLRRSRRELPLSPLSHVQKRRGGGAELSPPPLISHETGNT